MERAVLQRAVASEAAQRVGKKFLRLLFHRLQEKPIHRNQGSPRPKAAHGWVGRGTGVGRGRGVTLGIAVGLVLVE